MSENWRRYVCIAVMVVMLGFIRLFENPKRGFWCDDHSIRYPHLPMIVDYKVLLVVCIAFPLIIIRLLPSKKSEDNDDIDTANNGYLASIAPTSAAFDFMFGFLVNLVLTTYCKVIIARPRPNFYEICHPTIQCESNESRFVSDFDCTTEPFLSRNSLQSFFSGHSSTGTYAGLFAALHISAHWPVDYTIKALVCSTLIGLGLFPGFTQYLNHWHHWSDVLVGQLLGMLLAVAAFLMRHWLSQESKKTLLNKSKVQTS